MQHKIVNSTNGFDNTRPKAQAAAGGSRQAFEDDGWDDFLNHPFRLMCVFSSGKSNASSKCK